MKCPKCGREGVMVYGSDDDPFTFKCIVCHDKDEIFYVFRWLLLLLALLTGLLLLVVYLES